MYILHFFFSLLLLLSIAFSFISEYLPFSICILPKSFFKPEVTFGLIELSDFAA